MEQWYTLHTRPHNETRVYRALSERGFALLLPMLPARKGKPPEPLFPAYLFVRCDLEQVGSNAFDWIVGLRRLVTFDNKPAVMPDDAIDLIRTRLAEVEAQGGLPAHPFKPGDQVEIQSGPLAGLHAIFVGPSRPRDRVEIFVRFLGQANRAEVPVELLRPANPRPEQQRGTRGGGRRIHRPGEPRT